MSGSYVLQVQMQGELTPATRAACTPLRVWNILTSAIKSSVATSSTHGELRHFQDATVEDEEEAVELRLLYFHGITLEEILNNLERLQIF